MMKLRTEYQRFATELARMALDDSLPEFPQQYSQSLMGELAELTGDDEGTSKLARHIEYGLVEHPYPWGNEQTYGLKVKGKGELLSDLMHAFEELIAKDLPECFKEYDDKISHDEWKAVIRMAIDVVSVLDRRVVEREKMPEDSKPEGAI